MQTESQQNELDLGILGTKLLPHHKAEMSREGSRDREQELLSTPFMGTTCVACPHSPQDTSFPLGY